jgi:hypothetical protein
VFTHKTSWGDFVVNRTNNWPVALCVLLGVLVVALVPGPDRLLWNGGKHSGAVSKFESKFPVPSEHMGYALLPLLNNELVQRELALTPEQRGEIARLIDDYVASIAPHASSLHTESASSAARQAMLGVHEARLSQRLTDRGLAAASVLDAQQRERLDQILVRLRSIEIFEMEQIVAALGLTEDQCMAIRRVRVDLEATVQHHARALSRQSVSRLTYDKEIESAFRNAEQKVMPLLTAAQALQVERWRGKEIPFTRQSLRLVIRGRPSAGP